MKTLLVIILGCMLGLCGCITESARDAAVAKVANYGTSVSTRRRYNLSCIYGGDNSQNWKVKENFSSKLQPNVFADGGIPVSLRIRMNKFNSGGYGSVLLHMCSLTMIPAIVNTSVIYDCFVEVDGIVDNNGALFEIVEMGDLATSHLVPSPLWWYTDSPDVEGGAVFSQHTGTMTLTWPSPSVVSRQNNGVLGNDRRAFGSATPSNLNSLNQPDCEFPFDELMQRAIAYGVAVKLKELEDSGKIDAMLKKKTADVSMAPKHNIVRLDRDSNKNFSYAFELELLENPADFKKAWQMVLQDFAKSLKEDYVDVFPSADIASLEVSFSGFKRDGLRLSGSAAVLTLKPVSLEYNSHNRKGNMSVRFAEGQVSEASTWIRRNIKTLVRDKNIALTSGSLPPEGKFAITNEKIDGNVMTIEFMAE